MYVFDFRRMTTEVIDDPKPPPGFQPGTSRLPVEDADGIVYAALGSPPQPDVEDEE
jgi:hypothetical protein